MVSGLNVVLSGGILLGDMEGMQGAEIGGLTREVRSLWVGVGVQRRVYKCQLWSCQMMVIQCHLQPHQKDKHTLMPWLPKSKTTGPPR